MHVQKIRSSAIFIQIAKVLDLHFQGQRIDSSKLGISYVIISQTLIGWTNIVLLLPTQKVECGLLIGILTFDLGPGQGQGHAHFNSEYPANDDR